MAQVNEKTFDDRKGSDFESRATSDVEKKKLGISNDKDVVGNIKKVAAEIKEQAQASDMSEEPIDEPSNAKSDAEENVKEIVKKRKQKMNSRIVDKSEGEHHEYVKEDIFNRLHQIMNEKLEALKVAIALKERISFSEEEAKGTESYPLLKPGQKLKPMKLKEDEAEQFDEAREPKVVQVPTAGGGQGWKASNPYRKKVQYFGLEFKDAAVAFANKGAPQSAEEIVADHQALHIPNQGEQLEEASNVIKTGRTKIVKIRVRKGKVQRRKKVSAVKGYTIRGGRLTRMKASERLKRKIGQRRGKMKRKAKMARALMRRKRSMRKRATLGLKE